MSKPKWTYLVIGAYGWGRDPNLDTARKIAKQHVSGPQRAWCIYRSTDPKVHIANEGLNVGWHENQVTQVADSKTFVGILRLTEDDWRTVSRKVLSEL